MSEKETEFLKALRRTLLRIFIPVISIIVIGVGGTLFALPHRVKAMETQVKTINENYVDHKILIRYLEETKSLNLVITNALAEHKQFDIQEFDRINKRIDALIMEAFPHIVRGGKLPI